MYETSNLKINWDFQVRVKIHSFYEPVTRFSIDVGNYISSVGLMKFNSNLQRSIAFYSISVSGGDIIEGVVQENQFEPSIDVRFDACRGKGFHNRHNLYYKGSIRN
jgi:hypothetical protein